MWSALILHIDVKTINASVKLTLSVTGQRTVKMDLMRRTVVCYQKNLSGCMYHVSLWHISCVRLKSSYYLHLHCEACMTKQMWISTHFWQQGVLQHVWPVTHCLFTLQTVGGVCLRRHELLAVRMQKKGSFPGKSASMSNLSVMCAEHPSSVHAGWSLLLTVCKMTAGQGSVFIYVSVLTGN